MSRPARPAAAERTDRGDSTDTDPAAARRVVRAAPGANLLALLAALWLLASVTAARLTIGDSPTDDPLDVVRAAMELPRMVGATLIAGWGLGLAAALLYALNRARGRQHRGLSLTTMAAGFAATLLALSYIIDAPGALERGGDYSAEIGAWIGLVGGLVWTVGAFLLAKEPEGDDDWSDERTVAGHAAH